MLQWHTSGRLDPSRVLGRKRHRLGQGRHARAAADGRFACRQASGCGWRCRSPKLKLTPGTMIDGWAFTQYGGTVYWDKAGIETQTPQDGQLYDSLTAWVRARKADGGAGLAGEPQGDRRARTIEANRSPDERTSRLLHRARLCQDSRGLRAAASQARARPSRTRKQIDEQIPTTLVFREKAGEPKPAFMLKRGEYDQRRREGRPRRARVLAAASARVHRSTVWVWRSGWSPPTIR